MKASQLVSRFVISRVIYTAFKAGCQDFQSRPAATFVDKDSRAISAQSQDLPGRRLSGGAGGTRTPDFLLAKEALSQLSYGPTIQAPGVAVVGDGGLEPPTCRRGDRSNQLSARATPREG